MIDEETKLVEVVENAIEQEDNPYAIVSKIMWWELLYELNNQKSIMEAFKKETLLIDIIGSEIAYNIKAPSQISLENKFQKFKVDFLKLLMMFYKTHQVPEISDLHLNIDNEKDLDNMIVSEFEGFRQNLLETPEKWKEKIREYSQFHKDLIAQMKGQMNDGEE